MVLHGTVHLNSLSSVPHPKVPHRPSQPFGAALGHAARFDLQDV